MKIPYQSSMFSHWMCLGAVVLVRTSTLYNSVHNKYSSSLSIHNLYWAISIRRDGYSAIRPQMLFGQSSLKIPGPYKALDTVTCAICCPYNIQFGTEILWVH